MPPARIYAASSPVSSVCGEIPKKPGGVGLAWADATPTVTTTTDVTAASPRAQR